MTLQPHPCALDEQSLLRDCTLRRGRRSGPGGQHRNKVETAVVIIHSSGARGEATERRSQAQNRKVALARLRINLALEVRRPIDVDNEKPSELWSGRCRGGRISVAVAHADFAPVLAEALDWIEAVDCDVKQAAQALGSTTSQLIKLLHKEPRALAAVNQQRGQRGLKPLK